MAEEAQLSPEELAVVQAFRQQMADPAAGVQKTLVQHESLGTLLDGTKIQYRPGGGKSPEPALPKAQRWAMRERRRMEAMDAAEKRAARGKLRTTTQKVDEYKRQLDGRNVREALEYLGTIPAIERSYALLAEEQTGNRVSVLKNFPPVDNKVRAQYESEQEVLRDYTEDVLANKMSDATDAIITEVVMDSQADPT